MQKRRLGIWESGKKATKQKERGNSINKKEYCYEMNSKNRAIYIYIFPIL